MKIKDIKSIKIDPTKKYKFQKGKIVELQKEDFAWDICLAFIFLTLAMLFLVHSYKLIETL